MSLQVLKTLQRKVIKIPRTKLGSTILCKGGLKRNFLGVQDREGVRQVLYTGSGRSIAPLHTISRGASKH